MQGLFALLQSLGPMAAQGQDPTPILHAASTFIKLRQSGVPVAEAITQAFTPPAPPPDDESAEGNADSQAASQDQGQGDPAQAQGGVPGVNPNGLPTGVAPGQAGLPPGGRPDIQTLIAGMRGGQAQMGGSITRKQALGA